MTDETTGPDSEPIDAEKVVYDGGWRLGGPYTPELLNSAIDTADQLLRWANHATDNTRSQAFRSAPELYPTLGNLVALTAKLQQLLGQIGRWSDTLVDDRTLRHAGHRADAVAANRMAAEEGALEMSAALFNAESPVGSLLRLLTTAHGQLGNLYHEREAAGGEGE